MEIRNPIYTATGAIDCEIAHPKFGWIPFTATADDVEELGRAVFAAALDKSPAPYVPPPEPDPQEVAAKEARSRRDALLTASDWTQVVDAPVDQAAWAAYRQALRDVPAQPGFPENVIWPEKPA